MIYLFRAFLAAYSFVIPMLLPMYRSYGITFEQITILQSVYAISIVFWQLPSGWIADRFGRRNVLLIGAALGLSARSLYAVTSSFEVFVIGEMLLGAGLAFISGADLALLYDTLAISKSTALFQKIVARSRSLELVVSGICAVASGYIATHFGVASVFIGGSLGFLMMLIVALMIEEPKREVAPANIGTMIKLCASQIWGKPIVLWCIIFFAVLFAANQPLVFLWEPFLRDVGVTYNETGWFFCGMFFWGAFVGWCTPALSKKFSGPAILLILLAVDLFSFLGVSCFVSPYAALFFLGNQAVRSSIQIVVPAMINDEVDSQVRATVISFLSMAGFLLYALIFIPFGKFNHAHTLNQSFMLLGALALLGGIYVMATRPAEARIRRR